MTIVSNIETIIPLGNRVLICKEDNKSVTKGGIALPDSIEILVLKARIVGLGKELDERYSDLKVLDKIIYLPQRSVPVDFEGSNKLYIIPAEDVVAIVRSTKE